MSTVNGEKIEGVIETYTPELQKKMLARVAPQIFKRDGNVRKCPRHMAVKSDFATMLKTYNMVKNGIMANMKYGTESSISFCAKNVSVTITGAMAEVIATHPDDILASVIGNGWVIC